MFRSAIAMTLIWSTVGVFAQEFNWFRGNSTLKVVKGPNAGPCALDEQSYTQSSLLQINSPIANETNKYDLIFLTDNLESINGSVSLFSAVGFFPDNLQYWDIQTSLDNSTSQGSLTNDHVAGEAYAVNHFLTNEPLTPGQCTEAFAWTPQYMAMGSMLNYTMDASKGSLFVFGNTTNMAYQFQLEFDGFRVLA